MLTPKQQHIFELAKTIFGDDKVAEFSDAITRKLKSTPEIELLDFFDEKAVGNLLNDVIYNPETNNLFNSYIIPPFTTLDTRSGEWQTRRKVLDEYLGNSLVGRKGGLAYSPTNAVAGRISTKILQSGVRKDDNGTSKFDSVLCEILLKWFGFKDCVVLDPFAGGHIRGTMSSLLGYKYTGIDLSKEQVEANTKRASELGLTPTWICDDAINIQNLIPDNSVDLVFTCPPYGDLEKYTDDPRDLSNMEYTDFIKNYGHAMIESMAKKLKDNRFAVVVVGDFRDKNGFYRGFVAETINIAKRAGLELYNEMILLNAIGTASLRANNSFGRNRKVVKVHQNVLVFYKGDPTKIKELYGAIDSKLPIPGGDKSGAMLF